MKIIKNKIHIVNIFAAVMIAVMSIVDIGVYTEMASRCTADDTYVVWTEIDSDIVYADGSFDGYGSDYEHIEEDSIEGAGKKKRVFNVLEIVPSQGMGVFGYSISGCESIADGITNNIESSYGVTNEIFREAYMDALINKRPGSNDCNLEHSLPNDVKIFNEKMREGDGIAPFSIEWGKTYDGYYKYVGPNKGVYAVVSHNSAAETAEMVSKLYNTDPSYNGKFDYIWVGSGGGASSAKDIVVANHPRLKYKNNDKFLIDSYGLAASEVDEWKENNTIRVKARTPKGDPGIGVSYEDIENADLIVINSGNNLEYYPYSQKFYNMSHNTSYTNSGFSKSNDFPSFEYTIRIYERVAIREDVAFVASRNCVNGNVFDTNLRKLMAMLFYVNKGSERHGSGREVFMDFMKRYVDEPGNYYTIDPTDGQRKTYYEIRQNDERFIAPGLRGKTSGYMHQTHPLVRTNDEAITSSYVDGDGNTIPRYGESGVNNRRTAKRNDTAMYEWEHDRLGLGQYASGTDKENYGESTYEYYYSPTEGKYGVSDILPWSASEREKLESGKIAMYNKDGNDHKGIYVDEYKDYRWRMPLYESKSSTTDYVYIGDNGNFIRDTKYSGKWYGIDKLPTSSDGNVWEYKIVEWSAMNQETWPWNEESGCLKEWWFGDGTTNVPGNSAGKHIHLYYDYYSYNDYRAINTAEAGTYKNQSLEQENELFKGNLIKDAVDDREVKREITDEGHVVETEEADSLYYFLGVNIVNGDGVNKVSTNPNKVIYINDYEMTTTTSIPLNFEVRTSDDIQKIELLKIQGPSVTNIKTYTAQASNNLTTRNTDKKLKFSGGLELDRLRGTINGVEYDDIDGNPKAYTGPAANHRYIYTFRGKGLNTINLDKSYYETGVNNKFAIRVWTQPDPEGATISSTDYITVVVRDFFDLN